MHLFYSLTRSSTAQNRHYIDPETNVDGCKTYQSLQEESALNDWQAVLSPAKKGERDRVREKYLWCLV